MTTRNGPGSLAGAARRRTYRVPAVARAMEILALLARAPRALRVADISSSLGIGKGPCFAILKTLETSEAVVFDPGPKLYRLGAGVMKLGSAAVGGARHLEIARAEMERLAAQIRLACFLSGPYGPGDFVILAKAESSEKIKVTLDVGEHFPALGGGHGKALLAWQPPERAEELISRFGLPRHTSKSITDPEAYKRELQRTRRRGYAESYGEYMLGVDSVAAPIFDETGEVVLTLKTIGTSEQLSRARMRQVGRLVRGAAQTITARLGGQYPRRTVAVEGVFSPNGAVSSRRTSPTPT